MSTLRIKATENGKIDSRYIQTVDVSLTNLGGNGFEFLLLGYGPYGLIHRRLYHLGQGESVTIPKIMTEHAPFEILVVTNAPNYDRTGLTLFARNQQETVAIFTQEDAIRET
ncbi:hypothetical protein LBW89_24020 [Paenibacillus sp. alder61]|uniref:Uncharacterized protein n=1 Tax=Paenibacillus faecis TaxID=862114 RepID=A0A5D0CMV6_9BACL|nr:MULTISPECIES: hypothetical protein [Paenibacillus]MCA1296079.1 hypothetical protein [Paenibacillus sp. alder61]TYA10900.1 hypothetical protein FRY98_24320 [Paenibacillus faecis]